MAPLEFLEAPQPPLTSSPRPSCAWRRRRQRRQRRRRLKKLDGDEMGGEGRSPWRHPSRASYHGSRDLRQGVHLLPQLDPRPQRRNPSPPCSFSVARSTPNHRQQPHVHARNIMIFQHYSIVIHFVSGWQQLGRLDDPLMWGFKNFPTMNVKLARWVLAAEDICFRNAIYSYLFRLGKCIPITRGGGIYQENMNEALDVLSNGGWLHTFPEGKICQESGPIRHLKWGTASLIVRAPVTPVVLPIIHYGFEKVMPEKYKFNRRPPFPLINKDINIIVGEPLEFNVQRLKQEAKTMFHESSSVAFGWPDSSPDGLSEGAQRWLYSNISDQIRNVMEKLRSFGMTAKKLKV